MIIQLWFPFQFVLSERGLPLHRFIAVPYYHGMYHARICSGTASAKYLRLGIPGKNERCTTSRVEDTYQGFQQELKSQDKSFHTKLDM